MNNTNSCSGSLVPMTTAGSFQNCYIDWTPWQYWYIQAPTPPRECSGDVHVFPCPRCQRCKCGKATLEKGGER